MSSYYDSDDPHSRSAFLHNENASYRGPLDPWADEPVIQPPDLVDFVHEADSRRSQRNQQVSELTDLGQKDQTNDESSKSSIDTRAITGDPTVTVTVTVKQLELQKAVTVSETTTIDEASCRMASERVDVLFITDSNASLVGILTCKDIVTKAIASELDLANTVVSEVMTTNPVSVTSDTLVVDALQKMYLGDLDLLAVVENGEVIGLASRLIYSAALLLGISEKYGKNTIVADAIQKCWSLIGADEDDNVTS